MSFLPPPPTTTSVINSIVVETQTNDQTFSPRHPSLEHGDRVLSCGSQQEEHVAQGRGHHFGMAMVSGKRGEKEEGEQREQEMSYPADPDRGSQGASLSRDLQALGTRLYFLPLRSKGGPCPSTKPSSYGDPFVWVCEPVGVLLFCTCQKIQPKLA